MKLPRHSRTCHNSEMLSWIFWQTRRLLKIIEKYFEVSKTFQDLPNFRKVILEFLAIQETLKTHRKIFWSLQDILGLAKLQENYFRLVCPTWVLFVPPETDLSHLRLLCLTLDCCYVLHESSMSHWDWSVSCETAALYNTALSHTRPLSSSWDSSVPQKTVLSHMRLLCPTWDCSVHMRLVCPT